MSTTMTIADLERRLRASAPDEPAMLPPLDLPVRVGDVRRVSGSTRPLPALSPARNPRLALAMGLLALVAAGGIIAGALRLLYERTTPLDQLRWPPEQGVLGIQDGFTMSWPDTWHRLVEGGLDQGDFTQVGIAYERVAIILGSVELPGCAAGSGTAGPNAVPSGEPAPERTPNPQVVCLRSAPLPPGAVRVTVEVGERSSGLLAPDGPAAPDTSEPTREAGWTEVVDGQPARLTVIAGGDGQPAGVSEALVWDVIFPATIDHVLRFRADIGSGDVAAGRAAARAVLDSIRFASDAPSVDAAAASASLVRTIDMLDREARANYRSDFYTCFPRKAGVEAGTIAATPWQLLAEPVDVACTTAISPSRTGLWRMTLTMRWPAGPGNAAGGVVQELFVGSDDAFQTGGNFSAVDAAGTVTPDGVIPWPSGLGEPGLGGPPPGITPGSIVEILEPGGLAEAPGQKPSQSTERGWRATVIGGPTTANGIDWYTVLWDDQDRTVIGWLPAVSNGRPGFGLAASQCPAGVATLEAVRWLTTGERLACFEGQELSLGPVVLTAREPVMCLGEGDVVTTCPPTPGNWHADAPTHLLFGPGGPDGPVPGLAAWLDPGLQAPPLGTRLRVQGHFDDPRAGQCAPPSGDIDRLGDLAGDAAILDCRTRFVITGFETVAAP